MANLFSGSVIGEASVLVKPLTKGFGDELDKGTKASFNKLATVGGAAIAGIGVLLTKHGRDLQQADIALRRTIENSGRSFDDYSERVEAATKTQARFGHNAADTREALTKLALSTKSPDVAFKSLAVTADLAALKNISLSEAATLVGRVYAGNQKILTQFGITGVRAKDITIDLEKATNANSTAVERLNRAQKNLRDLEAQIAEGRRKTLSDRQRERDAEQGIQRAQTRGTQAVADAQEHLADVEAEMFQKAERDLSDNIRLREAQQAVVRAQESAAEDLADAELNLSDVYDEFNERQKLSVSDAQALRDARREVSEASAEASRTSTELAEAQRQAAEAANAGATNIAALQEKLAGLAAEQANTTIGKLEGIKTSLENVAAAIGEKTGPGVTALGTLLGGAGGLGGAITGVDTLMNGKFMPTLLRGGVGLIALGGTLALTTGLALGMVKAFQEIGEKVDQLLADHFPRLNAFLIDKVGPVLDTIKDKFDKLTGVDPKKQGLLTPFLRDFFAPTPTVKRHSGGPVLPSFQRGGEVPILAQSGEFVMSRRAVDRLGMATMEALNAGRVGSGGGAQTIVVPVMLDSREIARVIAGPVTDEQLRQNRGNSSIFGGRA